MFASTFNLEIQSCSHLEILLDEEVMNTLLLSHDSIKVNSRGHRLTTNQINKSDFFLVKVKTV